MEKLLCSSSVKCSDEELSFSFSLFREMNVFIVSMTFQEKTV